MAITIPAASFISCGGGEDIIDTPKPNPTEKDTTPPTIDVALSEVDITWWKEIKISGNQLYIWSDLIASWSDNKTQNCNVSLSINWKTISSWTTIDDEWTLNILVKDDAGNSKSIDIKLDKYKTMEITNIKPSDILPIVEQVEVWDREAYNHIEHLRLAEATRIRDMMWEYGAGNHSKEEYQKLMSRLNTGMMWENPIWYDNYESVWWSLIEDPSDHAHDEWDILNSLINHANFKVINSSYDHYWKLYELCKNNPNNINIMWISVDSDVDKKQYDSWQHKQKDVSKEKNIIILWAWGNIRDKNWIFLNKICQEDYGLPDNHSCYTAMSASHDKNDEIIDKHILVTIATNKDWDTNQTNQTNGGSKFPIWFHDKVLFAWRIFPYKDTSWTIIWRTWKYNTSYTNYVNVAMMDICFQMFAEAKDVDELLEMVRSTSLTDYIRFDGFDPQPLQLINPAWFFQKYLMPTDIPTNIKSWEYINLNKWYYKWVVFDIPWAEVKINGEWVEYSEKNKSLIKNQNPMTLEWRLNGSLCTKLYWEWKTIKWKIVVVDDKWNGLNICKDTNLTIK